MGCGIYRIINTKNNKIYIGSSVDIKKRKEKHFWMLQKGIHDNKFLQSSYNRDGKENFVFDIIEMCEEKDLVEKENYYILENKSNDMNFGYNLCLVSENRKNRVSNETKIQLSKYNLKKNNNFEKFALINIESGKKILFENLVDAANYLYDNGFTKASLRNIRMKLSDSLRGKEVNCGGKNRCIRKTCYKHKFKIIN
jgi:group I intron endonuclease